MSTFQVGDHVRLSDLGRSRKLYSAKNCTRIGVVTGYGKGEMTRHCALVIWHSGDKVGDLLHETFLEKSE